MTTSYLFAYCTLDSQVSLSSCMSIKTGLFFFLIFCCIMTPISGIVDHYCIITDDVRIFYLKPTLTLWMPRWFGINNQGRIYTSRCNICSDQVFIMRTINGVYMRPNKRYFATKQNTPPNQPYLTEEYLTLT